MNIVGPWSEKTGVKLYCEKSGCDQSLTEFQHYSYDQLNAYANEHPYLSRLFGAGLGVADVSVGVFRVLGQLYQVNYRGQPLQAVEAVFDSLGELFQTPAALLIQLAEGVLCPSQAISSDCARQEMKLTGEQLSLESRERVKTEILQKNSANR